MKGYKFRAYDKENELMVYSDKSDKNAYDNYDAEYYFIFDKNGCVVCLWEIGYDDSCGYPVDSSGELDNIMPFIGLKILKI